MTPNNSGPVAQGPADRIDVEALKREIRAAARRRAARAPRIPGIDADLLEASLRQVEGYADLAACVPTWRQLRSPLRLVRLAARCLARGVVIVSRFLTSRQREYNHAVLNSLQNVSRGLRGLEERQKAELQQLREDMHRLFEKKVGERARRAA
jgi:hypothetical protein